MLILPVTTSYIHIPRVFWVSKYFTALLGSLLNYSPSGIIPTTASTSYVFRQDHTLIDMSIFSLIPLILCATSNAYVPTLPLSFPSKTISLTHTVTPTVLQPCKSFMMSMMLLCSLSRPKLYFPRYLFLLSDLYEPPPSQNLMLLTSSQGAKILDLFQWYPLIYQIYHLSTS